MRTLGKAVRKMGKTFTPSLWRKLTVWRGARAQRHHWNERIEDVLSCPDNARLSRVSDAGKIVNGYQVMHNGLRVLVNGYYGDGITRMLMRNRGCHEPQEEVIFEEVLRRLPESAIMVELGAYWGFYSMWFSREVKSPRVFLVEPDESNLEIGRQNFKANQCTGHFTHAYVGSAPGISSDGIPVIAVDSFLSQHALDSIDILHSDVQGFEMEMLQGAIHSLDARRIRYLFISTHSEELHARCGAFLDERGYEVVVSVSPAQSYSFDGVLMARNPQSDGMPILHPSRKQSFDEHS
jgi:hypothetical protein